MTDSDVRIRPREPRFKFLWSGVGAILFIALAIAIVVGGVGTGIDAISSQENLTRYLGIGERSRLGLGSGGSPSTFASSLWRDEVVSSARARGC